MAILFWRNFLGCLKYWYVFLQIYLLCEEFFNNLSFCLTSARVLSVYDDYEDYSYENEIQDFINRINDEPYDSFYDVKPEEEVFIWIILIYIQGRI